MQDAGSSRRMATKCTGLDGHHVNDQLGSGPASVGPEVGNASDLSMGAGDDRLADAHQIRA